MFGITEPEEMAPEKRAREVAGILAKGYLRLQKKAQYLGDNAPDKEYGDAATGDISNGCVTDKSSS